MKKQKKYSKAECAMVLIASLTGKWKIMEKTTWFKLRGPIDDGRKHFAPGTNTQVSSSKTDMQNAKKRLGVMSRGGRCP